MTFYVYFFAEKRKKKKRRCCFGSRVTEMQAGTEFPNQCDAYFVCKKKAEKRVCYGKHGRKLLPTVSRRGMNSVYEKY